MAITGFKQGPKPLREITGVNPPLDLNQSLEDAVRKSIQKATWLEEADLGAAQQAVQLAATMDEYPNHRHKIAPVLIGLLSNLGLLNNRKSSELTPAEMLQAIANG
jgi:hypothetical protein